MSFSFDPALERALDRVRFALGDTIEDGRLVEDETIQAAITARGEEAAIAYLAQGLATKLSYQPDSVSIPGGPSVRFSRVAALHKAAAGSGASAGAATVSAAGSRGHDETAEYARPTWWTP